jgi:Asp-tRNA(Asn)/Glu-tRNA(Gln) amidotransferase A subunit family amidase
MGKTLEDIVLYSKAIIGAQPWKLDPKMIPIPWRQLDPPKKLKIAVLWNDGICLPTPPVTRALKETSEKLKKTGHEVLEWDPKLHGKALELLVSLIAHCRKNLADSFRAVFLWRTAERVSKHCSVKRASHIDQRCSNTQTLKSWAFTTCGSCN